MVPAVRPHRSFAILGGALTAVAVVALAVLTPLPLVLVWLVAAGAATFALYGLDKRRAQRGGTRVPEVVLHAAALLGGVAGGWAGRGCSTTRPASRPSPWCWRWRPCSGRASPWPPSPAEGGGPMTGPSVRPFTPHDAAGVQRVLDAVWSGDPVMRSISSVHGRLPLRPDLPGRTLVAVDDRTVVGVGSLAGSSHYPSHRLVVIDVAPQRRNEGIGTSLVTALREAGDARPWLARARGTDAPTMAFLARRGSSVVARTLEAVVDPAAPEVARWAADAADAASLGYRLLAVGTGLGSPVPVADAARAHAERHRRTHAWAPPAAMTGHEAVAEFCGPDVISGSSVCALDARGRIVGVAELVRPPAPPDTGWAHLVHVGVLDQELPRGSALTQALLAHCLAVAARAGLRLRAEVDDTSPLLWAALSALPAVERRADLTTLTTG
ncbi:MAG: DUF1294 domain-containing protein [Acidimicrobiales bacterium]|nr:DUF1294 domain-containing protein [Acidimicrobiales bacterium]